MKRFLTVLFAVCFVLTAALCVTAQAADYDIQYEIADIECAVGDEIRVPIYVDIAAEGIGTFPVDVLYDPEVLEFVGFDTTGGFAPDSKQGVISHELWEIGDVALTVNYFPGYEPVVGRHLFATVVFNVIGGEVGESHAFGNILWIEDLVESAEFGAVNIICRHVAETLFAIDATCTEEGLSEGQVCSRCGEILVPQQVIPALGCKKGDYLYDEEGHWTECIRCKTIVDAKVAHVEEGTCVCGREIAPVVPAVYEIIDDQVYADGELVLAYQLVEFNGNTYFVGDCNKIVKNRAIYVDGAWLPFGADGALTYDKVVLMANATTYYAFENGARSATIYGLFETADATYYVADGYRIAMNKEIYVNGTYWYFGADGKKAEAGTTLIFNDKVYVGGEWLRAYATVEIDGKYYFVSDYHKIARGKRVYINNPAIGGRGYYEIGDDGVIKTDR